MKHIIKAIFALSVAACAGGADLEDLGSLEQTYEAKVTTLYQMGTQTGSAHKQCDRVTSGQTCSVPEKKVIEFALITGDFTATETNDVQSVEALIDSATSGFNTVIVNNSTPKAANAIRMVLTTGTCSGTLSGNIEGYSCVDLTGTVALTEGVAGDDPVGNYQTHAAGVGRIDRTDIYNKGANTNEDNRLLRQAIAHAMLTFMGLGSRDDSGANGLFSRRSINLASGLTGLSAGETCRLDSYSVLANGDFSTTFPAGFCGTE